MRNKLLVRAAYLTACDKAALVERIVRLEQAGELILAMPLAASTPLGDGRTAHSYKDDIDAMKNLRRVLQEEV